MIFLTTGTQLPFDRLVRAVDEWALLHKRQDIFAQIGSSRYTPRALEWVRSLPPDAFNQRFKEASLIIGHAGMGTIISALELGKPVLVMPRRAGLGEHRNDHQLATVERMAHMRGVAVAYEPGDIAQQLNLLEQSTCDATIGSSASPQLLETIRSFIGGLPLPTVLPATEPAEEASELIGGGVA